jgi:hypothetical protein
MSTKSKRRAGKRHSMTPQRRAAIFRLEKRISEAIDLVRKEQGLAAQRVEGGPGEFTGYRAIRPGDDARVAAAFGKQRAVWRGKNQKVRRKRRTR